MNRKYALILLITVLLDVATLAQQPAATPTPNQSSAQTSQGPELDPNFPLARIREEGLQLSQVMKTLSYLSDVIGPRLTVSPNMKRANEWTKDQLTKWGLQSAHLESWGA